MRHVCVYMYAGEEAAYVYLIDFIMKPVRLEVEQMRLALLAVILPFTETTLSAIVPTGFACP